MWEAISPWENMEQEGPSGTWQRTWYTEPAASLAAIIVHDGGVGEGKQKSLIRG